MRSLFSLRFLLGLVPALMLAAAPVTALAAGSSAVEPGRTTGLPVPRFVSVKNRPSNVRTAPGLDYPVKWTFTRKDLPVEITAEFGNWRRIRDWEGEEGWMLGALLSGRRTALVAPWSGAEPVALHDEASKTSPVVALMQPSLLVRILGCDGRWCEVKAKSMRGYVHQTRLFGAYPGEAF
ncbi:hypothetical protein A33M_4098 [Rhodovulum sp. PH10]|uniref:SH3 domain-containing protein n=1 Tax=Rhodovulum sp. PH10 TaxID=1187851 RepID=UPI00027C2802|nr:SH3 domain-containing protein [Rhodovulum sp. PH10]EJW10697.1 hypothetical protein A33M_4098 [Rhodovulum sp. PH10]